MNKLLLALATFVFSINVNAQTTHTVSNTNDSGTGSLRDKINLAIDGDTIRFDENLLNNGTDTIILNQTLNINNKGLVFKGLYNSTDTLKISGNNANQIFHFISSGKTVIDSLVLINGYAIRGGAIRRNDCTDTLWILNSTISKNKALFYGGAITYSPENNAVINIINSTISENTAENNGGGIYLSSTNANCSVIVENSTISGNTSDTYGGGIYSFSENSTSSVAVNNSTISSNTGEIGGGIYSSSVVSTVVTITKSTIYNNVASDNGGGIYSSPYFYGFTDTPSSTVTIDKSTIYGNSSTNDGGAIYSFGISTSSINIESSIIANNETNGSGIYNSENPTITSGGYNIFSDNPVGTNNTNDQSNVTSAQLYLKPLSFYGGSTKTMVPGSGSLAVNNGSSNISDAQNVAINGTRDVGAAESCFTESFLSLIRCETYTVPSGDETYTTSGIFKDTIINSKGCDSIITIDLIINLVSMSDTTATICGNFTWYGIEYTTSGNYSHTLQNQVGCDSTITLNLTITTPDNSVIITENGGLEAIETDATYQWIDCSNNSDIEGETSRTYQPLVNGTYAVILTNNGCADTSECQLSSLQIIDNQLKQLDLYPNPSNGEFTIISSEENLTITIYGSDGKIILPTTKIDNTNKVVNLTGIESGVYFVKSTNNDNQKTIKLIIE
jgi:hypothetical protein